MIDFPGAADETEDRGILAGHFGIPSADQCVMTLWITVESACSGWVSDGHLSAPAT